MGAGMFEHEETDAMLCAIKAAFTTAIKERTRLENSFLYAGWKSRITEDYVNFDAAFRLLVNLTRYDTKLDKDLVKTTLERVNASQVPSSREEIKPIFEVMDDYLATLFAKRVLNYKSDQT